jgi:predicted RecA/RadA family phage recombinase
MNTFFQEGRRISWTNNTGVAVASSSVVVLGVGANRILAIAVAAIAVAAIGEVEVGRAHTLPAVTAETANVGDRAYWDAAASKLTVVKGNNILAGWYVTAKLNTDTTANILLRTAASAHGRLFEQIVPSTAVANTTVETAFDQSYTIPANTLRAGDKLRIRGQVIATATNSTDTLTVKLKIGATVIAVTAAVDVANSDIAYFDAEVVIRTDGANGTFVATGTEALGTPGTVTAKPFNLASTAIDTTAAQAVTMSATWSVTNAGDSCRSDQLSLEHVAN